MRVLTPQLTHKGLLLLGWTLVTFVILLFVCLFCTVVLPYPCALNCIHIGGLGRLYNHKSTQEKQIMHHVRNLINTTVVPSDPEKNMKAAQGFMPMLLHAHVVDTAGKAICSQSTSLKLFRTLPTWSYWTMSPCQGLMINLPNHMLAWCISIVYATELQSLGLLWDAFHGTIFGRVMVTEHCSFGSLSLNQQSIATMPKKRCTSFFSSSILILRKREYPTFVVLLY